jgi:hypothetical protein
MRHEFTRPDLPDPDLALETPRAYELVVIAQTEGSDSILVRVIYLPQGARPLDLEGSDSAI